MATGTAVALRCPDFMDAFQAMVAAKQKEIEAMNASQGEYLAVQRAIAKVAIPNDGRVDLTTNGAQVHIQALPTDHSSQFARFARAVGDELLAMRLHADGDPAVSLSGYWFDYSYRFNTARRDGTAGRVGILVTLPMEGIRDLKVVREERTEIAHSYRVVPRDEVLAPPAPTAGTVYETPPVDLSALMPF